MPTLTERRQQQTRMAIADAAVALFLEPGFSETTMEDVAGAAGVSRRSTPRWRSGIRGQTRRQLCRRGLVAVAALIEKNADSVRAAYSVFAATPALRGRNGRVQDEWYERYIELLTPSRRLSAGRSLPIATVAAALVGATTMLVPVWISAQPGADMVTMTVAVLDQLDSIWPDWLDR